MKDKFIIGSRGSRLALWQANFVKERLQTDFPAARFEIKIIQTTGDKILDSALSKIGDKGLFTRQIETALLREEIDLAVHSLKDLQTVQPANLKIGAVTKREMPNDVLISKNHVSLDDLPSGAKVATGSLRRRCQMLNRRNDLKILEIRGNVPTRIEKFLHGEADALILAYAGVHRLGMDEFISQIIPTSEMLPAVGQGALAIEIRETDTETEKLIENLNDTETFARTAAERAFLRTLEGGCQVPIAGYAETKNGEIYLQGLVGSLDGAEIIRDSITGAEAVETGKQLAEILLEKGAGDLLQKARQTVL